MPDTIKINLQNCYGIGQLEADLKFEHTGYAIYAPNGVMKTSFAKTMMSLSKGDKPIDEAFPDRESLYEVTWNDEPIKKEEIFVVRHYDPNYSPAGVSTLLANEILKERYELVHKDIGEAKRNLDKRLRSLAGYGDRSRENLDIILERIFGKGYYDALLDIRNEIKSLDEEDFSEANYSIIFNPKVVEFLKEDSSKANIEDFAEKYDELTEKSPILNRDFQYHHVSQVQQQLKSNNFFGAGHSINLSDKNSGEETKFTSAEALLEQIESEKTRVLNDAALREKFDTFNNKVKTKDLQIFRDYITENKHLLRELQNPDKFERKLWLQYILKAKIEYETLISKYENGKLTLSEIILEAKSNRNDWDSVIDDFNRRFLHLPFSLSVENKSDVILKDIAPSIIFNFKDGESERQYNSSQRDQLLNVLSTGEQRALYILNIMFEVYTRWKIRKKTLFIFDDIADSFDYKNKFAIIDYLDYVIKSEDTNFLTIILTHNFDFLRTIESRDICKANQCRMAFKSGRKIVLSDFKRSDIQNPFQKWQGRLGEAVIQIAYIPFLRNVIEYTNGKKKSDGSDNPDYMMLTKMLHYKDGTDNLLISDYKAIFDKIFSFRLPENNVTEKVFNFIVQTADECLNQQDGVNLEHKIVLSIATRMLAEKFIIKKIRTDDPEYNPEQKQMGHLLQDFKDKFNNLTEDIQLLKRVNLITPANIHLNAFMYEPILDMGYGELKGLYQEVKDKLNN